MTHLRTQREDRGYGEYRDYRARPGSSNHLAHDARQHFELTFGALAEDEKAFHARMREVFGETYDRHAAEEKRLQALAGDFAWLPDVVVVDNATLGGANGAYDAERGVVFLNERLMKDPSLAAATFMEEVGHHLDTLVNDRDTAGDEGEMFRRLMAGEKLNAQQRLEIQQENDRGIIRVQGKDIAVEFWNPFSAIADAVGSVVGGIVGGVGDVVSGIGRAVEHVAGGLWEGATGFVGNLVRGRFGEAFGALGKGVDRIFFGSTMALVGGWLDGTQSVFNGLVTPLPAFLRTPITWVSDRVWDVHRTIVDGGLGAVRGMLANVVEGAGTFVDGLHHLMRGEVKRAFERMGMGLFKGFVQTHADALLLLCGKGASVVQTLVGLERPGRKLTDAEISELEKIFGNSIDYSLVRVKQHNSGVFSVNERPFVLGNTIYLKDAECMADLVHEMAHVWQYQNGGSDYMIEALYAQLKGHAYDWNLGVPDTPWADLEPERQAEFIEAAWGSEYFDDPSTRRFTVDGIDYTEYLEAALPEIRAGRGAP